ncbi:MAG: hypothetical protein D6737_14425 [Chloroflexi bacterium]|nr:MAG: hypothetical protein D6737_14425 [Chloroflexota bacterium]
MIQLSAVLIAMSIFFGIIGFLRGWDKELISTAGIILGLFALFQFDTFIRNVLLAGVTQTQIFFVQTFIFITIVFFAYQTRALIGDDVERGRNRGRDTLQESVLGGIVGILNGYLIWGTLWYFMDINQYPLAPQIIAPAPGSPSEAWIDLLPLTVLGGGVNGSGDFLAIAVIILFLFVLIVI